MLWIIPIFYWEMCHLRITSCYVLNAMKNAAAEGRRIWVLPIFFKNRTHSKNVGEGPTEKYPLGAPQWPSKVDHLEQKFAWFSQTCYPTFVPPISAMPKPIPMIFGPFTDSGMGSWLSNYEPNPPILQEVTGSEVKLTRKFPDFLHRFFCSFAITVFAIFR